MVMEKTLESPLDCKRIKLVNPKGNQSLIFIGRTDAEAEALILWPLNAKRRIDSLEKILMLGKTEGRRRGQQRMRWFDDITDSITVSFSLLQVSIKDREAWHATVHMITKSWA